MFEVGEKVCSVEGCDKPHRAKGYCKNHHYRYWRHGSPLAGKAAPGEGLEFARQAARKQTNECILWPFGTSSAGYGRITVNSQHLSASRYVLHLATGKPLDTELQACHEPEVCHNRLCVNPRHLRWDTVQGNHSDKLLDGTHGRGTRSASSKINEQSVRAIRLDGRPSESIARQYGISASHVRSIRAGRKWGWLK